MIRKSGRGIRRVALVGRSHRTAVARQLDRLAASLTRRGLEVLRVRGEESLPVMGWTPDPEDARLARRCDLLITLGGDGTILAGARLISGTRIPLLPVNLGGLGYLASFEGRELARAVRAALDGRLRVEQRSLLEAALEPAAGGRRKRLGLALNDVVIKQPTTFRALRMAVWADEDPLGSLVADGIVAATPSGSTAYSLSAGGPILAPGLEALVVTPICPHTLATRALVLPPGRKLRVQVMSRDGSGATVSLDGLEGIPIGARDAVRIRLLPDAVRILRKPDLPFPIVLPSKLGWSGSPRRNV